MMRSPTPLYKRAFKILARIADAVLLEACIVLGLVFIINNYIGNVEKTISADGEGYYDYLPSIFIHHDLVRKDLPMSVDSSRYERIRPLPYVRYKDYKLNKYPCGTAVLELPFFMYALATTPRDVSSSDGYQESFQKAIYWAAIFYLFLSLVFLKELLRLFGIRRPVVIFTQLLLALATGITNYVNFDAGFSHVYSLFAITAFMYFARSYFVSGNVNRFLLACLVLGLVVILRQLNVLIVLFVPFLAGSADSLQNGLRGLAGQPKKLVLGFLLAAAVFFIQCLLWYLQAGIFMLNSYQNEGFNFSDPNLFNILFSYRKGLFVYTPVLALCFAGVAWLAFKRKFYMLFSWLGFFALLTYVLASWHAWNFGASYGLRAYIDYYAVFFVLIAIMTDGLSLFLRIPLMAVSLLAIPLNIIQTYQYKEFILSWDGMTREKYWKVFLETGDSFRGMIWKKEYDYKSFVPVKEVSLGNVRNTKHKDIIICQVNSADVPEFEKVDLIQVSFDNAFKRDDDAKVVLSVSDSIGGRQYYWHNPYLVHFSELPLNTWHTGIYNFECGHPPGPGNKMIMLELSSKELDSDLQHVKLTFLKNRYK